jgi:predicted DNA-binding transcriptional regulator AlpA
VNDNELLSEQAVSKEFRLSVPWQRKKRRTGDGPAFFKIGRLVRYRREDIEEFLRSSRVRQVPSGRSTCNKKAADSQSAAQAEVRDGHAALRR